MHKIKNKPCMLAAVAIACSSYNTFTMEKEQNTHLLIVPGHYWNDKKDHDSPYVSKMFPYFGKNRQLMHNTGMHKYLTDYGQDKCQKYLEGAINYYKKNKTLCDTAPLIIYASSQGTATAINYTAKHPHNITCLVLDTIMLTANSAIEYTFLGNANSSSMGYYLLPQLARLQRYSPIGEQPINNLDALANNLPIIILHRHNNSDLPVKDAQALYAYLTKIRKNQHVYLFTQKGEIHLNLLGPDDKKRIQAINSILALENILPYTLKRECLTPDQLTKYQPTVKQKWLDHFNAIAKKEKNMPYVNDSLKGIIGAIMVYVLGSYLGII